MQYRYTTNLANLDGSPMVIISPVLLERNMPVSINGSLFRVGGRNRRHVILFAVDVIAVRVSAKPGPGPQIEEIKLEDGD